MHRRAPAPKQEQRVNKKQEKSHTVTLKKFQKSFAKIFLLSANQAKIGLTSPEQNAQNQASVKLALRPQIQKTEARLHISVSH